jgi:hypothetical protein
MRDFLLGVSVLVLGLSAACSVASIGEEISHAVIYDAERGTIIEAITPTVREVRSRACSSATGSRS